MDGFNESDLGQAVYGLILNLLSREMHTAMPGRVEEVYVSGGARCVDVKPLLRQAGMRGEQYDFSIAPGVLLLTIGTSASSVIMPVQKDDLVLLIYSERALEHWKQNTKIANTIYARQFDLSDAFALPFNFKGLDTGYNNEDMIVEHGSQKITIKQNGNIEIGSTSLSKLLTEAAAAVYNAHTHGGSVPVPSGLEVMTALHETTKVKAQ